MDNLIKSMKIGESVQAEFARIEAKNKRFTLTDEQFRDVYAGLAMNAKRDAEKSNRPVNIKSFEEWKADWEMQSELVRRARETGRSMTEIKAIDAEIELFKSEVNKGLKDLNLY